MSEADYLTFSRERAHARGPLADKVAISLSDENSFARQGTLDFVDNALDRSSGTIHARATVPNADLFLTPGAVRARPRRRRAARAGPAGAGRRRDARPVAAMVMTVAADGTVVPKLGRDRRSPRRTARHPLRPRRRPTASSSTGCVRAARARRSRPQDGAIHYDAAADGRG